MPGGQARPLVVAGVAGGVGTSTWARILQRATRFPVADVGVYRGGAVDVLVSSNTAASTARIGPALALCARPPLLVVMHTVPGVIAESRSHLRTITPHITARFDIGHQRSWLEMAEPPGPRIPAKAKDIVEALRHFGTALRQMYAVPAPPVAPAPASPAAGIGRPATAPPAGSVPCRPPAPAAMPTGFHQGPR